MNRQQQRKGADESSKILYYDVSSRSLEGTTNDEGNEIHAQSEKKDVDEVIIKLYHLTPRQWARLSWLYYTSKFINDNLCYFFI